jgi:hypothetical protein
MAAGGYSFCPSAGIQKLWEFGIKNNAAAGWQYRLFLGTAECGFPNYGAITPTFGPVSIVITRNQWPGKLVAGTKTPDPIASWTSTGGIPSDVGDNVRLTGPLATPEYMKVSFDNRMFFGTSGNKLQLSISAITSGGPKWGFSLLDPLNANLPIGAPVLFAFDQPSFGFGSAFGTCYSATSTVNNDIGFWRSFLTPYSSW